MPIAFTNGLIENQPAPNVEFLFKNNKKFILSYEFKLEFQEI